MTNAFADTGVQKKLRELKDKDGEMYAQFLADQMGLPYVDLRMIAPDLGSMAKISEEDSQKYNIVAFRESGGFLHVATKILNEENKKFIENLKSTGVKVVIYIASENSMHHIVERYKDVELSQVVEKGLVNFSEEHLNKIFEGVETIAQFQDKINDVAKNERHERISKLIELTMVGGIHFGASDVHIEREENEAKIRFRIDGNLEDIYFTDEKTYRLINSRLKVLSGMKLSSNNIAQDGRFSIKYGGSEIEIRVSLVPSAYGEDYVMRILDPKAANVPFEALGMNDKIFEALEHAISKPFGMVLTTGPTGSGKSTTLYACLKKVYTSETKIITIEDPIEYHFDGITQTQVDVKKGYTFLSGLRAALRQDPDIIMVGEIRDEDTAKVATSAALTGHIVLSTLHTNSAAGAIQRFVDLGVSAKTLGSSLSLVMAQRLCRKLCTNCKQKYTTNEKESKLITNILGEMVLNKKIDASNLQLKAKESYELFVANPEGCEKCNHGYKGRLGVYEGIVMTREIENVASVTSGERDIRDAAAGQGIPTMREDGIIKVLQGITDLTELATVVDLYEI